RETRKQMKTITKPIYPLLTVFTLACFALSPTVRGATPEPSKPGEATDMQVSETYGKIPLSFEANNGQTDPQVKFLSRGNGYSLFLTGKEAVFALTKVEKSSAFQAQASVLSQGPERKLAVLRMKLVG